jgi:hypothetical protein
MDVAKADLAHFCMNDAQRFSAASPAGEDQQQ